MKVAVHGNILNQNTQPIIEEILKLLEKSGHSYFLSSKFADQALNHGIDLEKGNIYVPGSSFAEYDFVISIGGDGTLLETITHVGVSEKPILGVNTGRLGFLATINREMVGEALASIDRGKYEIDKRSLLRIESDGDLFQGNNFCLNEITVLKQDTASMITVHATLNGEFLNSYWADGLIISTPTGSTGYSLSCGGPVVMPHSNNLILTPVSPHNLNVRPLIVTDACVITLQVESRSNYFMVSLDSRSSIVPTGTRIEVKRETFKAKLIIPDGYSFVKTLRTKLNWGLDARN
jgi:NAD+ kinase